MMSTTADRFLSLLFPRRCFICKKSGEIICRPCLAQIHEPLSSPNSFTLSRFSYKDEKIKKIIHAIKFFNRRDLLIPIAKELIPLLPSPSPTLYLIAVPMPIMRKMMRGYNQSELLAKELSSISTIPTAKGFVTRKKSPERQVITKSKKERLKNQKNTFMLTKNVEGLSFIIIDDVTTTGATLNELRAVLLKGGASSVRAVTIAH